MADRHSRLLRSQKESKLVAAFVKNRSYKDQLTKFFQKVATKRIVKGNTLIKQVELESSAVDCIKAKVLYTRYASEVESETYLLTFADIDSADGKWKKK